MKGWGQNPNGTAATLSEVTIKVRSYKKCYQENIHNPAIESEESLKEHQICALGGAPEYANVCKVSFTAIDIHIVIRNFMIFTLIAGR